MVNLVAAQKPLLHGLMKMAGIRPYTVEIEPGTVMTFWVPSDILSKPKKPDPTPPLPARPTKPVVVLVHGFAAEGLVTWQFQVGALTKKYAVYVPDLLFFGGSATDKPDRSPTFQAECLSKALRKVGVESCVVVGFSYGGMVAFKMAEMYPEMVRAMVISGSILAMTDSISASALSELGFSSSSELLLPTSVKGLKALLSVAAYKKLWFPDRLHKDFLQVMFTNRKERGELLEGLVISNKDLTIPKFPQRIHLLWGENDQIFKMELAQNMKEQLGENVTYEGIKKAGHLVHLERPCVYNRTQSDDEDAEQNGDRAVSYDLSGGAHDAGLPRIHFVPASSMTEWLPEVIVVVPGTHSCNVLAESE
ncbi:Epoxide hydrolase 4 [Senna tora]|uniref:Epoxide hydrolase 4 n=1 Tax=Senna tora TaxID=362788 RepID=A0A834W8S2_9FABA|nr:Epoxide hydrolase 4 [Senna tora]